MTAYTKQRKRAAESIADHAHAVGLARSRKRNPRARLERDLEQLKSLKPMGRQH